ncbi:transglycosylase SLT domain-containing protein [Bacillus smithii]|uniref:transglycosylase SLT domain-containing protein n=1 Tax=Bacillus smithii TaxID=1479 RepID=UPI0022DEB9D3|nr:transglycosylase SLT domain-containing protein [Bacillus smithii]
MSALRDMTVNIGFTVDPSPLMELNREMNKATEFARGLGSEITKMQKPFNSFYNSAISESKAFVNEFSRQSDVIRRLSRDMGISATHLAEDWRDMSVDMRKSLIKNHNEMRVLRRDLLGTEMDMRKLGMQMGHYTGTTDDFMREIQRLGKVHKKISDQMINSNLSLRQGMIQSIATMSAMSSQSDKITKIYGRMNNALLNVNKPFLNISSNLARMAREGNAAQLALEMLGPNAKMKDLQDTIAVINQGIMRQQAILAIASAAWLGFTAIMAHSALGPDPEKVRQQEANLTKIYRDSWNQRVSEISNFVSLFEKASIPKVKGSDLTKALQSQVDAIRTWRTNLQGLVKKGVDDGLIKELQKAGPAAAGQVKALNNMSRPELNKYVSLWREKMGLARTQATDELTKLREETRKKIQDLQNSLTPLGKSWERFKSTWASALQPFVETWGQMAAMLVDAATKIGQLIQKLNEINPWIVKIAGMFAYLASTLFVVLTPLSIGIGLFKGLKASLAGAFPIIGPIIEGLGAMSGTVLVLAAGIVAVSAALADMWKNSETFRNIVTSALSAVSDLLKPLITGAEKVVTAIAHWDMLSPIVLGLAASLATLKVASIASIAITKMRTAIFLLSNPMARAILLTKVWTSIQKAFNLSLLANPFVAIAAALVGLAVGLTLAYNRSEKFRKAVNEAFTVARNVVGTSIQYIKTVSVSMWNGALAATEAFRNALGAKMSTVGTIIVNGFKQSVSTVGTFFGDLGNKVAGFFGAGLGTKAKSIAGGFISQLKAGFSSIGGIVSLVAPMLTGIVLSLMGVSGPIGIAISAVVSLIGTLYRLSKTNADVRNALVNAWNGIKTVISSVLTALSPIFKVFQDSFAQMARELGPEFQKTGQVIAQSFVQLQPAFQQLGAALGELGTSFISLFSSVLQTALPMFGQILQSVIPLAVQLFRSLAQAILSIAATVLPMWLQAAQLVFPMVLQIIRMVIPFAVQMFQTLIPVIVNLARTIIPLILQAVIMVFPMVLQIIRMVLPIITQLFVTLIPVITKIALTVIPYILTAVRMVFPIVLQIVQMAIPIIASLLSIVAKVITNLLIPAIRFILKIVQIVFPAIMTIVRSALNIVTNVIRLFSAVLRGDWSAAWNAVKNILSNVWTIIKTVIRTGLNVAVTFIKSGWESAKSHTFSIFKGIKDFVSSTFDKIVGWAKALPGKIGDGIRNFAHKAVDGIKELAEKLIAKFKSVLGIHSPSRVFMKMGGHIVQGLINGLSTANLKEFGMSVLKDFGGGILKGWNSVKAFFSGLLGGNVSGSVSEWISAAMAITGVPSSWLGPLVTLAMHESGGNPRAINLWDSNYRAGHPSKGLMQTIDSTFNAYKLPGMNDIWNPVHNAVAAIRYMLARYGSIGNVPGIRNLARGKGYVGYATGGIATKPQIATLAENGWKEYIIPTQPSMRKNALSLLAQANAELGYNPSTGGSTSNTYTPSVGGYSGGKDININYNVEIKVEGNADSGTKQNLKQEFQQMLDDHYKKLQSLFESGVVI